MCVCVPCSKSARTFYVLASLFQMYKYDTIIYVWAGCECKSHDMRMRNIFIITHDCFCNYFYDQFFLHVRSLNSLINSRRERIT